MAAIRYLYNRMNSYQLTPEEWRKEEKKIQQIHNKQRLYSKFSEIFFSQQQNRSRSRTKYDGQSSLILVKKHEPTPKHSKTPT
jgi:hypothetical protein